MKEIDELERLYQFCNVEIVAVSGGFENIRLIVDGRLLIEGCPRGKQSKKITLNFRPRDWIECLAIHGV